MKRTITCLLALALALSLAACTPAAEEPSPSASGAGGGENKTAFTAGTYTGTARGREGNVSLEVTFSADAIESITLKEHNDTPVIFNAAFEEISGTITAHQSLAVETVAGATISSNAILGAVKDCVKQAGGSVEALMTEIPKKNTQESLKADVVVVGGGGAGLAAAVEAANQGAKVILVEAQGMTGGSTGLSTGMLISAASEQEKNEHGALMLDDMINALKLYGSEYYDESISRPFLAASRENRDWVMGLSRAAGYDVNITYESCFLPFDPEHPEEPGDTADYTVVMAETQDYIDTLIDGPLGFWITEGLYKAAREAGVEIYLNTRANEVLSENGAATGIRAVNARTGVTYTVEAKSVILACGGFGADAEWAKSYTDPGGPYMGAVANTGFGIRAAEELGAKTLYTTVYGTEDYPEVYATIGGVVINNEMQVLNESDEPIAGLYSAGEMASVRVMDPMTYLFQALCRNGSEHLRKYCVASCVIYTRHQRGAAVRPDNDVNPIKRERINVMPTTYSTYIPEESQDDLERHISGWLRYLGIYGTLAGHKYLVTAIMQTIQEPDRVRYVTKELYPDIAKLYHTTMSRVERAMRTAVKTCWEDGGREALDQMAGFHLHQRPTNSEFIDLAAAFFRR